MSPWCDYVTSRQYHHVGACTSSFTESRRKMSIGWDFSQLASWCVANKSLPKWGFPHPNMVLGTLVGAMERAVIFALQTGNNQNCTFQNIFPCLCLTSKLQWCSKLVSIPWSECQDDINDCKGKCYKCYFRLLVLQHSTGIYFSLHACAPVAQVCIIIYNRTLLFHP